MDSFPHEFSCISKIICIFIWNWLYKIYIAKILYLFVERYFHAWYSIPHPLVHAFLQIDHTYFTFQSTLRWLLWKFTSKSACGLVYDTCTVGFPVWGSTPWVNLMLPSSLIIIFFIKVASKFHNNHFLINRVKDYCIRTIRVVRDSSQLANPGSFTSISNTIHKLCINVEVFIVNQIKSQVRISLDRVAQ